MMNTRTITSYFKTGILVLSLCVISVYNGFGQVEWLKDASNARIPSGPVTGQIDGKPAAIKFGNIKKTGYLDLGSPDSVFDHFTIRLQDAEEFFAAKMFADITLTVRRGELPDGKTFRRTSANWNEQPGMRGEGYWVPEFLSLSMESRKKSMREEKIGEFGNDFRLSSGVEQTFTGRVEFDKRKSDKINASLYLCFEDKTKSCLAGTVEIDIR